VLPICSHLNLLHLSPSASPSSGPSSTGTLLIIDETHTICEGPGGYTAAHGLQPDIFVLGKPIAGALPLSLHLVGLSELFWVRVWTAAADGDGW
jgi:acetylornithine/succinyldiaminopimelate/putrescine aminotransferase